MTKILISACLVGKKCRYDAKDNLIAEIKNLAESQDAIIICPEELGGLSTPRPACEISKDMKVRTIENIDFTKEFRLGAEKCLQIAKEENVSVAILKANSPSCGFGEIYDGSFSKKRINGNGICAELLSQNGIKIYNEDNYTSLLLSLKNS